MAFCTLIYGVSGSRKTTALGQASAYLYERSGGKPGRAIYSDGGGYRPIQGAVDAGLVEPYIIIDEPDLPDLLHKLARGYWPEKLENGICTSRIKHPVTGKSHPKLIRPTPESWKSVGFYLFEGLTSTSELLMKYLRDTQQAIGGEAVGKFEIKDAEGQVTKFCSNNMKHYDWVQGEMITVLAEFAGLPIERVMISAHEAAGTDDDSRDPIRGPALVGKAGTAKVPKNVADCFHFEVYLKPDAQRQIMVTDVRGYFESHPDPKFEKTMYNCKSRVPRDQVAALRTAYPGGHFDPSEFERYLALTDRLVAASGENFRALRREADQRLRKEIPNAIQPVQV